MQVPTGLGTRRRANSPQHHSRRRDDRQARAGCRQSHRPILGRVMNRKKFRRDFPRSTIAVTKKT